MQDAAVSDEVELIQPDAIDSSVYDHEHHSKARAIVVMPQKIIKHVAHKVVAAVDRVAHAEAEDIHRCCGCFFGFRVQGKCCYGKCDRCVLLNENRLAGWLLLFMLGALALALFLYDFVVHDIHVFDLTEYALSALIIIATPFSILAVGLSLYLIWQHRQNPVHPKSQKWVKRILWMIPIYALSSWCGIFFTRLHVYTEFVRTIYEAFALYSFMMLLTKYVGNHDGCVQKMLELPKQPWPSPFCFLPRVRANDKFLWRLKYCTLQYVVIVPICAVVEMICQFFGVYYPGQFRYDGGYAYVTFVINISQMVALYGLIWLYSSLKPQLAPFRPLFKFLVVKAVVFFTFWQGILISVLAYFGLFDSIEATFSKEDLQNALQDFLVCVEMFLAAMAHKYTFGIETYADGVMKTKMFENDPHREDENADDNTVLFREMLNKERLMEQFGLDHLNLPHLNLPQFNLPLFHSRRSVKGDEHLDSSSEAFDFSAEQRHAGHTDVSHEPPQSLAPTPAAAASEVTGAADTQKTPVSSLPSSSKSRSLSALFPHKPSAAPTPSAVSPAPFQVPIPASSPESLPSPLSPPPQIFSPSDTASTPTHDVDIVVEAPRNSERDSNSAEGHGEAAFEEVPSVEASAASSSAATNNDGFEADDLDLL